MPATITPEDEVSTQLHENCGQHDDNCNVKLVAQKHRKMITLQPTSAEV